MEPGEYRRRDLQHVSAASFARCAQSLRVIEEYAKLLDAGLARRAEELRFRVYELEKATATLQASHDRLARVRLCVLLDGREDEATFESVVADLIQGGADMIQLREKLPLPRRGGESGVRGGSLDDRTLLDRAKCLVAMTRDAGVLAIVNDRVDVAVAAGADGVHLGQDDLPVAAARRMMDPSLLIGVSTHSIEQARQAVLDGADYLGAGPVFPSRTKSFELFPGVPYLRELAREISLPAFAIGGITADNVDEVLASGITRVAVSSAVLADPSRIARATTELVERVKLTR
jgi:thiamine-phosphate pyrophosphorylase